MTLNPATGAVTNTLVARHVLGDEVSVTSTGMIFIAVRQGCNTEAEGIPIAGGAVAQLAQGACLR